MIEVRNLTKLYGQNKAIDNLNFSVRKGEVVGFLGPNGAGKSTTMKIITGFMSPSSGEALVGGIDVFEKPLEVKKKIGYLPETPPVYGDMHVREYLAYVAELKGVPQEKIAANVQRALNKTNLQDVQKRLIQNLSKGFRQRVGIAQALVSDPEILILDEPTVGLDPKQVAEIRDLINELRGQHTIILSTHILSEVQATCERIIIINKGQIVAQDSIENLSKRNVGSAHLVLRLKESGDAVMTELQKAKHVLKVEHLGQEWRLECESDQSDESLVEQLASLCIQKRWGLSEIRVARQNLEDVFLKLTYGANGHNVAAEKVHGGLQS